MQIGLHSNLQSIRTIISRGLKNHNSGVAQYKNILLEQVGTHWLWGIMLDNVQEKETLPDNMGDANQYVACQSDMVLQTIIYLEQKIEQAQEQMAFMVRQKELLLNRALKENINTSGDYALYTIPTGPLKRNPIKNIADFKEKFREAYAVIRDQQKRDLQDAYQRDIQNIEAAVIPLTLADKKAGKDCITDYVGYAPQAMKVEVRKRERLLG